ncbi:MAG: hypothetical protein ACQERD_01400 [Campylobacterota bacterium]
MQLIYKIDFNTTNKYFKYILKTLINEFSINAKCKQYKGFILIQFEDEPSRIEEFFAFLEKKLPISIFLGKSQVLDSFDDSIEELENKKVKQNIKLLTNDTIKSILDENSIDFLNDIVKLSKGEVSKIETYNGLKDIFLPNKKLRKEFEKKGHEVKLLVTDVNKLSQICEVSQKDLQLLCSIERPLVKLKFKLLQNRDNEYSSTNFIYVKIPDDKQTVLFADALRQKDINFVLYVTEDRYQDGLKATYFGDTNLLIKGDKALFPKYDHLANKKYNSSKEYFDDNGGVYKATLAQFNKRLVPSVGVYFSLNSNKSSLLMNLPTKGLKNVIMIPNIHNSVENALDEIEQIDEFCERLITNYKNKFPKNLKSLKIDQEARGFKSILNICAKVLGIKAGAKGFEDLALSTNIKSGIQIDMKVEKIDGINYLDYRRVIQSMMSYKMADVDNSTLAYSFYESLGEFITNYTDEVAKEISAKDVVITGDMFANSILLSKTHKNLSKNYNFILPKEYPLDY